MIGQEGENMLPYKNFKDLHGKLQEVSVMGAQIHTTMTEATITEILNGSLSKYVPKYFAAHEFLPPEIYQKWGDKGLMFMDVRILWTADAIRERFAEKCYINTYNLPNSVQRKIRAGTTQRIGKRRDSGLRLFVYNKLSYLTAHKFGRAIDIIVDNISAAEVRQEIKSHPKDPAFRFITRVEKDRGSYNHLDCVFTNLDIIYFFNP